MRLGYPVVSRHVSMGTRTLAGHRRLRAERSTSAFCSIWLRIGNSMGREVFKRVRRESAAAYLKVCAMLVPREMQVEHSGGVKAMTDEQLERGIELIKEMLAQREAGANARVVRGVAEPMAALPAPSRKARSKVRRSDRADSGLAARVVETEPNAGCPFWTVLWQRGRRSLACRRQL